MRVENEESRTKETEKEKGYEALIKPIQDVIAKDWKVRLCNYLDIYIEHIHEPGTVFINFTEAALLVQNTSTYYCRRVDLMYNWVRQFSFSLAEKFLEATTEEGEVSQEKTNEPKTSQKKQKKNKNQLHSDELETIPLTHTESKTINFKLDKIDPSLIRKVVLNSCMKTQTKPATCIPVQQSATEEMGFKDEFRLHWKIAYDGHLHEDFRYDTSQGGIAAEMYNADQPDDCMLARNEDSDDNDSGDIGMDTNYDNDMDIEAVPPVNPELSGSVQLNTDMPEHRASEGLGLMPDHQPVEVSDVQEKVPKKQEENFYTVIPFASLIMHRKFKKRQVFKLPKELIEEVSESRKKQKKKGKNDEDGKLTPESDYNYHLSFSEILGGKSEDMIQHKLGKRRAANLSKRRKRAQSQAPSENNNVENAADLNNDTVDDDDHDFDDIADDMADQDGLEGDTGNFGNFENAYEASAQLYGQIMKTENDPLSITKRVAAWHAMIQPVLEKAEARSVFSVNEYGTKILENFKESGEVRQFADLVAGQPKEEICRYFLSTLMLANTYNLEIQKTTDEELAKDCLQMKLLSKVRHHEELDANVGATTANGPML
ncbi:condensin-2 complex subunit H2 [Halyomorpha halys]|uniref:condensin-2 complex subunit H2 n=1 Tax=Halyomorpha halys TaxID=286706 RepID=UPI0006D4F064|nr:condensin-2 complex subunit H2-like [Halyomorpha halys]